MFNKKFNATHPQKRIWYNELLFPDTSMHNIVSKINMGSNVNIDLLEKSINLIIEKNDSLRLKFCEENGALYEYVQDYEFVKIPFLDFSKYNSSAEKKLKEFLLNDGSESLYKQNELLFKFYIYKTNDENIGILTFVHHLIFDGMSCNLLLKQLSNTYSDLCNGQAIDLTMDNSYIDFIYDEKEYLNSEEYKENKQFWNDKFSNLNENSLYIDCKSAKSKVKSVKFNRDMFVQIKKFLTKYKISLNRFFIAVSSIYMSRVFDDNDITLAVACFNRTNERQKNTIGMFTGTMPLRVKLEEGYTFSEFIDYLNSELKSCYKNQKYPYDLLVQDLRLKKRGADSLFKFCVNYYAIDSYNLENNPNINIYTENIAQDSANVPLHIFIKEIKNHDEIELELQYRIEDYTENQIEQIINGMMTITNQIISNSNIKISEIQVISDKEKDLILNKFNDTKKDYDKNKTIKELFEETAKKHFNKTALVSNGENLTYEQLNERANKLARILKKNGISKEDIVPILCDRSIDTIIGMLAIVKTGAAYLPIDEDYPQSRIEYMIKDSNSKILLTKKHQLEKIDITNLNVDVIDLNDAEISKQSSENIETINCVKDLVYVIYTSGSTGNPKGVCIENRNLMNLISNSDYIDINENDKILQSGSLSFDASVFQIWIALLNGATLHLEDKLLIINGDELKKYIDNNKITVMLMPTPLFNKYAENNMNIFKNLRILIAGGDVLSSRYVSNIVKVYKDLRIINAYGPTENTVISTTYEVKGKWDENVAIPIGKPISNSTAYIMDKNNNLLPIGVYGELCVGGDGIAREYLNREDITKKNFIENPYVKGERIYKTGDLAKYLPDGNIDFIGRIDYQVKINGFRIEMQEIEANLLKYPKIKEAVVVDKKDRNGNKYVCAYVISSDNILSKEVKEFLKKEIPSYMIPSYIIQLQNFPVNCNGKIDRKLLPDVESVELNDEYIPPKNYSEEKIAKEWSKVLGIESISTDLNFFEIGGNSLKAISVVSDLSKEFNIEINDIFEHPTIQELALNIKLLKCDTHNSDAEAEVSITVYEEKDNIPQSIKSDYDLYIKDIKKYKSIDLSKKIIYKNILLTGSTGYVGINILNELMIKTESTAHLLLRGRTIKEAENKIIEQLNFYFGEEFYFKYNQRIKILLGDIGDSSLGLDLNTYKKMSLKIDCIINSAANVKHYGRYEEFYKTNVLGVKNLLDFAKSGVLKDFNQISTISVANGIIPNKDIVMFSEDDIDVNQESDNVYVKSKLEAEKLVAQAGQEKLNTKIFRLGNVTFNYETGNFQRNINDNGFYQNIKSFIKLGCIPKIEKKIFDFSYVDQLSKAIILLFDRAECNNQIFHIENPEKLSTLDLMNLLQTRYKNIEVKNMSDFIEYISLKKEDENLKEYVDNVMIHLGLIGKAHSTTFLTVTDRTNAILNNLNFKWSKLDECTIKKMLDYCEKIKFL